MRRNVALIAPREKRRLVWSDQAAARADAYGFQMRFGDAPSPELLSGCDAVMTTWGSVLMNGTVLSGFPEIRILGHAAGSVGMVTDASTYDCLKVVTANPVMAEYVAQWQVMMVLAETRRLFPLARFRDGEILDWDLKKTIRPLETPVIGIWGYGDITRALLRDLLLLDPGRILVFSRHASGEELARYGAEKVDSLEELLPQSRIFLCNAALTGESFRQLDAARLAMLPDNAAVINSGRANLIEPEALRCELESGRLHAILDVFQEEPLPRESRWNRCPNLIMTPHMAAGGGTKRYALHILEEFQRFFRGEALCSEITKARFATMGNDHLAVIR